MRAEITTPITPALLRGAVEYEHTEQGILAHRLPHWARIRGADEQLLMAESQPSGVRVVARTEARWIELTTIRTTVSYVDTPARPDGVYDLAVDGQVVDQATGSGGRVLEVDLRTGARTLHPGTPGVVAFSGLPPHNKLVEIYLPHTETTELVGLRSDAPLVAVDEDGPVWVHHGSSISQGSNAARPSGIWPVVAARQAGVGLVNLGFGGGALLDGFTARVISQQPAQLISLKLGINVVNADVMRRRALIPAVHEFLDVIREGHPDTPLLVISPVYCPIHESTPGPCLPEFTEQAVRFRAMGDPAEVAAGRLSLEVIREVLAEVVQVRGDTRLGYLDGRELYGPADAARAPLPDGLHPDAATHQVMGQRFAEQVLSGSGVWALSGQ